MNLERHILHGPEIVLLSPIWPTKQGPTECGKEISHAVVAFAATEFFPHPIEHDSWLHQMFSAKRNSAR